MFNNINFPLLLRAAKILTLRVAIKLYTIKKVIVLFYFSCFLSIMHLEWNLFTVIYDREIFPYLSPSPSLSNQVTNYPVMSKRVSEIYLLSFKRGMFVLYAKYSKKLFLLLFEETLKAFVLTLTL